MWKTGSARGSWVLAIDEQGYPIFTVSGNGFDGSYGAVSSIAIPTDTFQHIAGTYDPASNTIRIFVNGAEVGQAIGQAGSIYDSSSTVMLGGQRYWIGPLIENYFDGVLDDVRVWDRARTAPEIESAMNAPLTGTETGLVQYWPFDEGSGAAVADVVSGNNGQITGATWASGVCPNGSKYDDLVFRFAPVIYQDIDNGRLFADDGKLDLITDWQFDGDSDIANNWNSAGSKPPSSFLPYVYYSIAETRTHYFLGYYFYHPRDWEFGLAKVPLAPEHEHDLEGAMVVVAKPAASFDDIVLTYTQAHDDIYYFFPASSTLGDSLLDIPSGPLMEGCGPSGSRDHRDHGWGTPLASNCDILGTMESTALIDIIDSSGKRRPSVFIESNGHGVGRPRRAWSGDSFHGQDGVIYSPASDGIPETPPDSVTLGVGDFRLRYALLSFESHMFAFRHGNNSTIFSNSGNDTASLRTIRGLELRNVGHLFRGGTFGIQEGAHAPWWWPEHNSRVTQVPKVVADRDSRGDWLIDPAWMVRQHVAGLPPEGRSSWDVNYLYNPYMQTTNVLEAHTPVGAPLGAALELSWAHKQSDVADATRLVSVGDLYLVDPTTLDRRYTVATNVTMSDGVLVWPMAPTLLAGNYRFEVSCELEMVITNAPVPRISSISEPFTVSAPTSVPLTARTTGLGAAAPNPFNPSTSISFTTASTGHIELVIYDLAGRVVRTLVSEYMTAGEHNVLWNGTDEDGRRVASGVYLYQLRVGEFVETKRMVSLK